MKIVSEDQAEIKYLGGRLFGSKGDLILTITRRNILFKAMIQKTRLQEDMLRKLKRKAEEEKNTVAAIVRDAVSKLLKM